jgi:N-acetylglucosamine kinase-like BadF-type ATPase
MSRRVLIAVDGGGSKTDAVALSQDGEILARASGPSSSPQNLGLDAAVTVLDAVVREAIATAGSAPEHVACYLSGLDLPEEIDDFTAAISGLDWARSAARPPVVDNDLFALLRVGTGEPNAVAVVCGTGINAIGVREDGASVRFPALGAISGDWGGGGHLGQEALWHAARAEDGRGKETLLRTAVPDAFGLPTVRAVTEALHFGRLPGAALASLAPVLFSTADAGDEIALALLDRQIEEIVAMAVTALRRLQLLQRPVPVVLGGGVIAAGNARLLSGIRSGLADAAPLARPEVVMARPVVGASLLVLDQIGADAAAHERVLATLG